MARKQKPLGSLKRFRKGKGAKLKGGSVMHQLTCPRACRGEFYVELSRLREGKAKQRVVTTMCPYCSRVSLLPK